LAALFLLVSPFAALVVVGATVLVAAGRRVEVEVAPAAVRASRTSMLPAVTAGVLLTVCGFVGATSERAGWFGSLTAHGPRGDADGPVGCRGERLERAERTTHRRSRAEQRACWGHHFVARRRRRPHWRRPYAVGAGAPAHSRWAASARSATRHARCTAAYAAV